MTRRGCSIRNERSFGFTIIELLLVITIIGAILAVIVPRAWRAGVEAKYGLVQQNCTELASWANEWAQRQLESQPDTATSVLNDYYKSLGRNSQGLGTVFWVGLDNWSNWNTNNPNGFIYIDNRGNLLINGFPTAKVQQLLPPEKLPRNPFNGVQVFSSANDSTTTIVPGAIGCTWVADTLVYRYYALIYLGTDSTTNATFHAGQDSTTVAGLRNGVFMARLMP
jgi:type II secretory pathway pseudopilin PulG